MKLLVSCILLTSVAILTLSINYIHQDANRKEKALGLTLLFLSDEGPTLETLDFTIHIGSAPTFLHFDSYLNTACAAHVYFTVKISLWAMAIFYRFEYLKEKNIP